MQMAPVVYNNTVMSMKALIAACNELGGSQDVAKLPALRDV